MLLILLAFCVLLTAAAAIFRDLLPHLIRYVFFLRFPILIAAVLLVLPLANSSLVPDLWEFKNFEVIVVTALALLAGWTCILTAIVVTDTAPHRFGTPNLHVPKWLFANGLILSSFLALPLILRIGLASRSDPWLLPKIVGGVAAAFGTAWIIGVLRQLFVPHDSGPPPLIPDRWIPRFVKRADLTRPLVRPVLSPDRLRKFPRVLGAGYIDYGTGTIHPGPAWLLFLLVMVWLACGYSNHVVDVRMEQHLPVTLLPTLGYIEVSLILLTLLLAGLSFFFDRYLVSVTLVALFWITIPHWTSSAGHFFHIHRLDCANDHRYNPTTCGGPAAVDAAIGLWLQREHARGVRKPVLVVVCASGGGTQAAAWTTRVLTGLQEELGQDFTRSIRLFSGVSGGSLGLFYFLTSYDPILAAPPSAQLPYINQAAQSSTGDSLARSVVTNDLLRTLLPFGDDVRDRGWQLERTWSHSLLWMGQPRTFGGVLSDWRKGVEEGWMPGTIFNSTIVETGGPLLFSTVDVLPRTNTVVFGKPNTEYGGADIDLLTAVRLSASFAWISPASAARYEKTRVIPQPALHVVDGAYYDNFGVAAVVGWCWAAFHHHRNDLGKIVILQIHAHPVVESNPSALGLFVQALAPVYASTNVRDATQRDRDDAELDRLNNDSEGFIDTVVFTAARGIEASWSLPTASRRDLEMDWRDARNGPEMRKLRALLEAHSEDEEKAGAANAETSRN